MTRFGHRGFTLLEALVSFTVLLLAMGMMVALFVPSMSLFRRQSGKSDSYRNCLMMMEKFQMSILNSQTETITLSLDGQAISWQEFEDSSQPFSGTTGDAQMSPDFGVIFYGSETKKAYYTKKEGAGAGPNDPAILSFADLAGARNVSSKASRVLAHNITQFYISDKGVDAQILEPPITLSLTCEIDTRGQETKNVESFQLTASVTPRSRRW